MKKLCVLALTLVMALSLVACGNSNGTPAAGSSSNAASTSGTTTSSSAAAGSTETNGEDTLVVDMMGSVSSMGSVADYISAFTMTYHFTNDAVSSITEEITLTQDMSDDATISALESSLSSQGTVSVDGSVVTVTLNDISNYDGKTKTEVKTALEAAGYTVTESK